MAAQRGFHTYRARKRFPFEAAALGYQKVRKFAGLINRIGKMLQPNFYRPDTMGGGPSKYSKAAKRDGQGGG